MLIFSNDKLEVREIQTNNLGMFAKKDLKPWISLLETKPLVSAVIGQLKDKVCSNCMIEKQVSRCANCKVLHYCSRDCQKQDWKFHKDQCSVYKKMHEEKGIKIANITAQFSINLRAWVVRKKNDEVNTKLNQMRCLLQFQPPQKCQQFQQMAVVLMDNLNLQKNEQNLSGLMKQMSTISINGFTVQDYLCNIKAVGVAIYYPSNFINHNCHPNCVQIYDGNILKIAPRTKIKQGDQICISYVEQNKDFDSRNQSCRKNYMFQCFCQTCQIDRMFDWQIFYLLCPKCGKRTLMRQSRRKKGKKLQQEFMKDNEDQEDVDNKEENQQKVEEEQGRNPTDVFCKQCEIVLSNRQIREIQQKVQKCSQIICGEKVKYQEAKKKYFELKKILHQSDPTHDILLNNVYLLCLEKAFEDNRLYSQAFLLLKDLIEKMPIRYRLNLQQEEIPYTYIWKYAQMGKLGYNLGKKKKAWEFTEKAFEIVQKINFSHNFSEVKQLKQRYQQLKISLSFDKAEIFSK